MNFNMSVLFGVILAGLATVSLSASAGGYVGVSMGQSDYDAPEDGTSFELKGGFKLNDNFSVQGSYVDYGDVDDNEPPVWTMEADAIELSVIGSVALSEQLSLTGLLGIAAWDVSVSEEGFGNIGGTDGTDLTFGVGLDYAISDSTSFVLQYKGYDIKIEGEDADLSNFSAGLNFHF